MVFCDKLIQLRRENGYSQEQLANQLNVSRQAVSKWEAGNSIPELEKIIAIADIFGVSVDYLVRESAVLSDGTGASASVSSNMAVMAELDEIKQSIKKQYVYEYKSKRTVFGMPFVHIKCARNGLAVARGFIAIGNVSVGVISIGGVALGLVSIGGFAFGILTALAGIAVGGISFAGVSIGILALGGVALGEYAIGGVAVASKIALGAVATGNVAIGSAVDGAHTLLADLATKDRVREVILEQYPNLNHGLLKLFLAATAK